MYGDFPAKNTVYTPYIYGSDQPYIWCCCCFLNEKEYVKLLEMCRVGQSHIPIRRIYGIIGREII